jgi:polyisoprenoid-binding protein YceI
MAAESEVIETTRRWALEAAEFAVDTALGPKIRGSFGRFAGSYQAGPEGTKIEVVVDPASIETGTGFLGGLLGSGDVRTLTAEQPPVRFRSTSVRELGDGRLRVEGYLDSAGKVEPLVLDAAVKAIDGGLRLETATTLDRQRLGESADRFALFLPATVHVTLRFGAASASAAARS